MKVEYIKTVNKKKQIEDETKRAHLFRQDRHGFKQIGIVGDESEKKAFINLIDSIVDKDSKGEFVVASRLANVGEQKEKDLFGHETEDDIKELERLNAELEKQPENTKTLLNLGMLLSEPFHLFDLAIACFEKAAKIDPKDPQFPFWVAYFLCMENFEYKKAKKMFEQALLLDSDRGVFNHFMFYVLYEINGDDEPQRLKYLLKAIELQPEWPTPRKQYITYLINHNDFEEAYHELKALRVAIDNRCKNKRIGPVNILEKFYFGASGFFDCEVERKNLDYIRCEIDKKKKTSSTKKFY